MMPTELLLSLKEGAKGEEGGDSLFRHVGRSRARPSDSHRRRRGVSLGARAATSREKPRRPGQTPPQTPRVERRVGRDDGEEYGSHRVLQLRQVLLLGAWPSGVPDALPGAESDQNIPNSKLAFEAQEEEPLSGRERAKDVYLRQVLDGHDPQGMRVRG